MYTIEKVTKRKDQIFSALMQQSNWKQLADKYQTQLILYINFVLVEYITKLTDYLANEKITVKDIAVIKEFLEPFKWD